MAPRKAIHCLSDGNTSRERVAQDHDELDACQADSQSALQAGAGSVANWVPPRAEPRESGPDFQGGGAGGLYSCEVGRE